MTIAPHYADHAHHAHSGANRIRTVINKVSKNVSDSNGNFKAWVVKTCWQELSLNGVVYRRFLGETHCLFQRGVLGQPRPFAMTTFMPPGRSPILTRDITVHIPAPLVQLFSLKPGASERLVQLLVAVGMSDAPDLPEGINKKSLIRQPDLTQSKPVLSPHLLSLLANAVSRLPNSAEPEVARRVLLFPVLADKALSTTDQLAKSVKSELLQLINKIGNGLVANSLVQQKTVATDKSVVVLSPTKPSAQPPVRHGIVNGHSIDIQSHTNAQKTLHQPVPVATTNKPGVPQQTAPIAANASVNMPVATQLNSILTSAMPVAVQPMPMTESGPKQLPPIILPNAGHGAGNRSERKKSKKEREKEEEEERERSRHPFLFDDDDDDPLDSDEE